MPEPVNVLLIGGGGREHALAIKLRQSARLGELWITHPENPGLAALGRAVDVPVNIREIYRLQQVIERHKIGLIVIGPEEPLAEGFVDKLTTPQTKVFGPRMEAARLEGDKGWAKQVMRAGSIPTAESRVFGDPEGARAYCESREADDPVLSKLFADAEKYPDPQERRKLIEQQIHLSREVHAAYHAKRADLPVVKAVGLAKGKGVVVPGTLAEALTAVNSIMVRREHGDAGRQVLIEERLHGREVSLLALCDGNTLLVLPPCQDHKRLGDGDTGPNTGGMGAFCPADTLDEATMLRVEREVLVAAIDALRRDGIEFRGVLYAGLIITHAGPKVLEFNVRFGDPECQPLMARLKSDLIDLLEATCDGTLAETTVEWDPRPACCVVLASEGYPVKPTIGVPITGIDDAEAMPGVTVTHGGTRRMPDGRIVTNGGRVLSVTALGDTLEDARARAYAACEVIRFAGKTYRTDIGSAPKA